MSGSAAEDLLREALDELAGDVEVAPDGYRGVRARWLRQERRRRRWAATLAVALVLVADGIGLWALNSAPPDAGVIFRDSTSSQQPEVQVGQP